MSERDAIDRAITKQREESIRPKNWLCLTDAEVYQLLAGTVPESVKLACYDLTNEAFDALLTRNSEKPTEAMKAHAKKQQPLTLDLFMESSR